jgi:hypothetical protein
MGRTPPPGLRPKAMMAEQHRAEIANAALTGPAGAPGQGAHPLDGAKRWAVRRNPVGPDRRRADLILTLRPIR